MTKQEIALYKLGLSKEEIADVLEKDKLIDKGEKLFELSKEQEQASKKARSTTATKTPTVYTFKTKREKRWSQNYFKLENQLGDEDPI